MEKYGRPKVYPFHMTNQPPIEYLAGIFDGEGSVCITMMGGRARKRPLHVLAVVVAMCHEEIIVAFHGRFGGEIRREALRENRRQQWRWRATGATAASFLAEIEPHLIVKREQALLGLEFTREKRRYKPLPDEELLKRESYRQRMWALNGDTERAELGLAPGRSRKPFDLAIHPRPPITARHYSTTEEREAFFQAVKTEYDEGKSCATIGQGLGLSRRRIRQIVDEVLASAA